MSSSDVKATTRMLRQISDPNTRRLLELVLLNIDILKDSLEAVENPLPFEWIDAVLENGWVQFGDNYNTPQFTKLSNGVIMLRGTISSGTAVSGTVMFSLPVGFRPDRICRHSSIANGVHALVDILPNGDVVIQIGTNTYISLDGLSYEAHR